MQTLECELRAVCPSDAMLPIDLSLVYIAVPTVLVSILILIKLGQKKMGKILEGELPSEEKKEVQTNEEETKKENLTEVKEPVANPETSEKVKPQGCLNYLGYLYMKKAPSETHIPTECYSCHDLLKCLYSPVVVEKVYGE